MNSRTCYLGIVLIGILILVSSHGLLRVKNPSANAETAQDIVGGASSVLDRRPPNPPVFRRQSRSKKSDSNQRTINDRPDSSATAVEKQDAGDLSSSNLEDALYLGNSARDSNPPRYEDAIRAYKLASKLAPGDPRPFVALGNVLYDQQRFSEAANAYRDALRRTSPGIYAISRKDDNRSRKNDNRPPKDDPPFIAALPEVIRLYNKNGHLHAYLGNALIDSGDLVEAESEFKEALRQDDKNPRWHALLGYTLFLKGKFADASRSYRKALSLEPQNATYIQLLKQSQEKQKR